MRTAGWGISAALLAVCLACGTGEAPSGTAAAESEAAEAAEEAAEAVASAEPEGDQHEAMEEAQKIFAGRCFTCHGPMGEGNGPGSAALVPKPRNFTDAAWQASVTDDHIAKIIQYGGAAVGKSPAMPGNPDLMSKPEVVQALVAHIRTLSAGS